MSRIRSVDTKAEVLLRKALFARGYRYRKNVRQLPGTPDIVLPKHRYAIQVRGCFWHSHGCNRSHTPTTNVTYWMPKLARNVARDKMSEKALRALGWRLRVVWECKIASANTLAATVHDIASDLSRGTRIRPVLDLQHGPKSRSKRGQQARERYQ